MEKRVSASGYGLCLFSADMLQDFLKKNRIRKRKLLSLLQKDKELYLTSIKEGVWVPLAQIDYYAYAIRLEGQDQPFDSQWEQKIDYGGFNLEIRDGLWVSGISKLEPFEPDEYHIETGEVYKVSPLGQEFYHSPQERWYTVLNGWRDYTDIKYDVPAGKYHLSIKGYIRKEKVEAPEPNCGFYFSLTETEAFDGFKNPRESDDYDFNVGNMRDK
ncbi:MAG: hypothetical protein NC420_04795 [Eubacterium sp.]|nr:hypothetical protein [Eubacterium sp.]MCM1305017.1 hypothetical protein [Butyrivibrio sp.]MCM1344100.1 hypothetical protein [Muribaculaceae bacterium]MCM1412028.1 hypothetical protein [Lachnospiraceae bacterium]